MTIQRSGRAFAGLLLLACAASAQDFSYPDFSSVAGLAFNGNAGQSGNVLRVTPAANGQKGSAFYDQPTRVAAGFTCTFTFQITSLGSGGADGMAFVIHNAAAGLSALGDDGSGMGYAENSSTSIENCLAVEIDTWDSGLGDPNNNHVSVHTGGTGPSYFDEAFSIGNAVVANDMSDGGVHTVVVAYDGATLEVFVDDLVSPLISAPWDFTSGGTYIGGGPAGGMNLISGSSAYVGFTAGTGGANENHDVLSWSWKDAAGPIGTNYCGPANLNSSGAPATISGLGQIEVAFNSLALTATSMPPGELGFFLCSQTQTFIAGPGGSLGNLCVGGKIGRFASQVQSTGAAGEFTIQTDLTALPVWPNYAAQPGETWNFQAWFSDGASSNFSEGLTVTFQ